MKIIVEKEANARKNSSRKFMSKQNYDFGRLKRFYHCMVTKC